MKKTKQKNNKKIKNRLPRVTSKIIETLCDNNNKSKLGKENHVQAE